MDNETSLGTVRFVQAQKSIITLEVEGDADRFACEFLYEKFRRALDKSDAQGKSVGDECCDRLKLWQVDVKLVCPDCNAVKGVVRLARTDNLVVQCPHGSQERGSAI